jgi:hypothetical protein
LPSNQGFTSRGDLNASGARGFVSCSLDDACSRGFSPGNKRFSRDFDDLGALGSFTPGSKGIPCEFDDSRSHGLATSKRVFPREFSSREFVDGSGSCRFTSCEFSELGTHEFGSCGFDNSSSHRCADSVGEEVRTHILSPQFFIVHILLTDSRLVPEMLVVVEILEFFMLNVKICGKKNVF